MVQEDYRGLYRRARGKAADAERLYKATGFSSPSDIDGKSIEKAGFTVPKGTSFERIKKVEDKYQYRFGQAMERQGLIVLHMGEIEKEEVPMPMDEDRDYWCMRCLVTRERPVEMKFDVPDEAVSELEVIGLKLTE